MIILDNVSSGLVIYPAVIDKRIREELPFMATENIIMALVHKGASRQEAHERIRVLSHEAAAQVKSHGKDNDLIKRIRSDPFFKPILDDLEGLMDTATFIGRAPQQVEKFLETEVKKALAKYPETDVHVKAAELHV